MSEHFITIPCEPAKGPDLVRPLYEFRGYDSTGAAMCNYRCPHCGIRGYRYVPMAQHMGLRADKPVTCRVLLQQDKQRRNNDQTEEERDHG